ncbi:hypothetical protein [Mycobacteroides abscessus]|uniref:hypothetical protein n=1 Tax=Mycobacteroides abscessus TaxID=36809 RepID=UPI000D8E7A7D|nr:hypothetical protein [Mycobacteroides abscessus]SPX82474.1 Uncharacterised protein [Mycobacteroides abscessus]
MPHAKHTPWIAIRRTGQKIDPNVQPERTAAGVLRIGAIVTIKPEPPNEWHTLFFQNKPSDLNISPDAHYDDKVTLRLTTSENTMELDIRRLDALINIANSEYENRILPAVSDADTEHEQIAKVADQLAAIPPQTTRTQPAKNPARKSLWDRLLRK